MAAKEHVKERIEGIPPSEYFQVRQQAGWRLVAVEWERESGAAGEAPTEEVPYGLRVAGDCQHLEYEPNEMATLTLLMELIIQEHGFPQMARAQSARAAPAQRHAVDARRYLEPAAAAH